MLAHGKPRKVPFQLHPRVFAALGLDLVTNDFVAITELVKNAYDAFADRVDVRFARDVDSRPYIEICDNGLGMDESTVESVWCVVATPFRASNPISRRGGGTRHVAGEKGLGRLSAARLGDRLEMVTQARSQPCLAVEVQWPKISQASKLRRCVVELRSFEAISPVKPSGTRLRIHGLRAEWTDERIDELSDYLARLISPFSGIDDFSIWLSRHGDDEKPIKVVSPAFLKKPKYRLSGTFDTDGLNCRYSYKSVADNDANRLSQKALSWTDIQALVADRVRDKGRARTIKEMAAPECGSFSFEIRAWDVDQSGVDEIAARFNILKKASIRESIRAHKGVSVYRDGILVLPKAENARDWLGLDLRRVSELGKRLSTSQIIGYVAITAKTNPAIKDTSDRERLVESDAVIAFEEIIKAAVSVLEDERQKDRLESKGAERPLKSLFGDISAESLNKEFKAIVDRDGSAKEAAPLITRFSRDLDTARQEIERRFVYYSRLATIGTLAEMLVHEVRTRTTVIDAFLSDLSDSLIEAMPVKQRNQLEAARSSIVSLDRLADTFAPLASRSFGRGRRTSVLEARIRGTLEVMDRTIKNAGIEVSLRLAPPTEVEIDPGELDAILFNLIDNAVYWVARAPKPRRMEISTRRGRGALRVHVGVHDSGPGVPPEDDEKIFWPGITTKPAGIGMGLTIASEIVDAHDGKMALVQPGDLGGATFEFDLPIRAK
jgi:signal transduction histidine kinase